MQLMPILKRLLQVISNLACFTPPPVLRNDENIILNISVTDIIFDGYLEKWNYRVIPKVKNLKLFFNHSLINESTIFGKLRLIEDNLAIHFPSADLLKILFYQLIFQIHF